MTTTTLEQLRKRYTRNFVTLTEFRADFMPHINNEEHLLRTLRVSVVPVKVNRLHASQRAARIIYLHDLADWLDAQEAAARAA